MRLGFTHPIILFCVVVPISLAVWVGLIWAVREMM
jgi:hypothetical protein